MANKRFDELFFDIVTILRQDYAGKDLVGGAFDPRYYNQAIGQAWRDGKLNELLFLRYISQMLASTGDRHLRFSLRPSECYDPWHPGFFTRRYEDALYVTAVTRETRLKPGDKITHINGGAPAAHRAGIQKNFFYAEDPEREDWGGLLKMAESITVARAGGPSEQLALARHPAAPYPLAPAFSMPAGGIAYLRPAAFDGGGENQALLAAHEADLAACKGLILDLQNGRGDAGEEAAALLPWLCRADTPLASLLDTEFYVNYTRRNCLIRAAGLQGIPGGEEYVAELVKRSGSGFVPESDPAEGVIPGRAPGRVVVLTDVWCRGAAEELAQAARRAGACLLGRPTMGTLDLCGDVHYELDGRYTLTWPTAVTRAARDGRGVLGRGLRPDVYIPWTPRECGGNLLLQAALAHMDEMK